MEKNFRCCWFGKSERSGVMRKLEHRPVYLDNHATTQMDQRVLDAMLPYFSDKFGNPHSDIHYFGWEASEAINISREQIANSIGANADEIVFTSGATEANNLALKGVARLFGKKKDHIITCVTEHPCVLESVRSLVKEGMRATYLNVNHDGLIDITELEQAITKDTLLVSVMAVQNEIGTIQPLSEIGEICHRNKVYFHSDGAQALGKIPIDVKKMNIDMMSITGHKVYGPMGCGALYIGKTPKVKLMPLFSGGGQERGIRSGTLPTPLCVGFGKTCELAIDLLAVESISIGRKRDLLLEKLTSELSGVHINGCMKHRVAGNLNLSIDKVDAESLIASLPDLAFSTGSACSSNSDSSYVLKEIGLSNSEIDGSMRIGLGRFSSDDQINYAGDRLIEEVRKIRNSRRSIFINAAE